MVFKENRELSTLIYLNQEIKAKLIEINKAITIDCRYNSYKKSKKLDKLIKIKRKYHYYLDLLRYEIYGL